MTELKPCPFCSGTAGVRYVGNEHTKKRAVHIYCQRVGCTPEVRVAAIQYSHDWCMEQASKRWNNRPIEDALRARIKELEDMLDPTQKTD